MTARKRLRAAATAVRWVVRPAAGAFLRLLLATALALSAATATSCGDRVGSPRIGQALVTLQIAMGPAFAANTSFAVRARVVYPRTDGIDVPLFDDVIASGVAVGSGQASLTVDIAPCLADASRVGASSGCTVLVRVTLLDGSGAELDRRTIGPLVVAPGQSAQPVTATLYSQHTLTVTRSGRGSGSVTLSPVAATPSGGLYAANTNVTLTATPSPTSIFSGWSGDCAGTSPTCVVRLSADRVVNAAFDTTYAIAVAMAGGGSGTVAVSPPGPRYAPGTAVTLTATAAAGSTFSGWSGACSGSAATCALTMDSNKAVTATFVPAVTYSITVTKTGSGSGTVTANPPGPAYAPGTSVVLTAIPATGSVFTNWSGACSGTASTCTLTMTANRSVTAVFTAATTTYDGNYTGTYGGTASGPVAFTVRNGIITVTQPGSGQGTVASNGSASFSGSLAAFGCTATFTGTFFVVGSGLSAGGTWACGADSGSWSATGTRVP